MRFAVLSLILALASFASLPATGDDAAAPKPEDLDFFEKRVRPVLVTHCYECHSDKAEKLRGGLRLDHREGVLAGGESGAAIVPGEPDKSLLIEGVRYDSERLQMPPAGKLPAEAVEDLREWVRRGAPFPTSSAAVASKRGIDLAAGRRYWAFQPVQPMPLLMAQLQEAGSSAGFRRLDPFVQLAQRERGLRSSPVAPRQTLVRRLKLDLVGLPPMPEEIQEFCGDSSPDAFERLADRYLASPHYGERWGRTWLDLARYCDIPESWREGQAKAWLYRDWVTQAMNADLPYNDFVRKQLAADMLPGFEPREAAALGFLGLSPTYWKELKLDHTMIKQVVAEEWEERIDAIGSTFLGLTLACARCHDHKFDPITQHDYYALAGVLASIKQEDRPIIAAELAEAAQKGRDRVKELQQQIDKIKAEKPPPANAMERIDELEKQAAEIRSQTPHYDTPLAFSVSEASLLVLPDGPNKTKIEYKPGEAQNVAMHVRGNAANAGVVVPRRFLSVLAKDEPATFHEGSGRRELAEAIVTDAAPLAARVIVNRVWKQHFGRGLVNTPSNFGAQGERSSHPELLDDLTTRFIEHGWSLKWLHREMVLSATYQQSSRRDEAQFALDPDNIYVWRMPIRRLEVEAWRDAMLAASGELDLAIGGPPMELSDAKNHRRTLYGIVKRRELSDILRLHDFPDPIVSTGSRVPTTSPLQQLFVFNSPYMQQRSQALVQRLQVETGDNSEARIRRAYWLLHGREALAVEVAWGLEFIAGAQQDGTSVDVAWREYAQALLASNEVLFVD